MSSQESSGASDDYASTSTTASPINDHDHHHDHDHDHNNSNSRHHEKSNPRDDSDSSDENDERYTGRNPWKKHRRHRKRIQAFVPPTPEMMCWTAWCLPCIAPRNTTTYFMATFTGICAVTPLTNVTNFSLQYQMYLNAIFHREWVSFLAHAITMPIVDMFLLVLASYVKFGAGYWVDLSLVMAALINVWYIAWGITNKVWWMGFAAIPIVWGCYAMAHVYAMFALDSQPGDSDFVWYNPGPWYLNPLIAIFFFSMLQAGSHFVEDLPPRVSGSPHWTTKREFFCGTVDDVCELADRLARAGFQMIFGTLDELVASPRLLPLFWGICPVYKFMRVFNLCKGCPTRVYLDESYAMFEDALIKLPRMKRTLQNGHLISRECEDGEIHLSGCGKRMDWIATNICCMASVVNEHLSTGAQSELRDIPDPALDYVGLGGGTFLRWEPKRSDKDACCGVAGPMFCHCMRCEQYAYKDNAREFKFDYWSARMNQCQLLSTDEMFGRNGCDCSDLMGGEEDIGSEENTPIAATMEV